MTTASQPINDGKNVFTMIKRDPYGRVSIMVLGGIGMAYIIPLYTVITFYNL